MNSKIIAVFPGESKISPCMFYSMNNKGEVYYHISPSSKGAYVSDSYKEFRSMVSNKEIKADLLLIFK